MSSNSFGTHFRFTTFGESHGPAIGVVIDGCPPGIALDEGEIALALKRRAPGRSPYTSPRSEPDRPKILSGLFEGKTTGAPITVMIENCDADPSKYEPIKDLYRPGHANYTYLKKYGIFDYRGGGRSSARETASRVIAGAVAAKIIEVAGIKVVAFMRELGGIRASAGDLSNLSTLFCPDHQANQKMEEAIEKAKVEGDSLGGIVEILAEGVPAGLGDPVYEKLEVSLAAALLSIPATKGFEIGDGFEAARMKGSEHNDPFVVRDGEVVPGSNHAGGTLGGISTGMPLVCRVAFKPTSSIAQEQETVTLDGEPATFTLPPGSRHDPCVAIRGVPVAQAMVSCVLADKLLRFSLDRESRESYISSV